MVGIYKYENGLQFTGVVAETKEKALEYLTEQYGVMEDKWTGKWDENDIPVYEKVKVFRGHRTFEIKEIKFI